MARERVFGRGVAPDARDRKYLISIPRRKSTRTYRYWYDLLWRGNQGYTPQCVAYSWLHYLADGPVTHKGQKHPLITPATLYKEAKKVDEWPGENYDGTSVRAGAKVLQSRGLIGEYHWAQNLDALIYAVLELGPVVVGSNWYAGMSQPDAQGLMHLTGELQGGHAWDINGVNVTKGEFRMKQSWEDLWGIKAHARISFADMAQLINENAEACLATEVDS